MRKRTGVGGLRSAFAMSFGFRSSRRYAPQDDREKPEGRRGNLI